MYPRSSLAPISTGRTPAARRRSRSPLDQDHVIQPSMRRPSVRARILPALPTIPALSALIALLLAAAPAAAQVVTGTVLDATSNAPIAYAEVVLLDKNGKEVNATLSDTLGLFAVSAPDAGRYTLAVRHIGYVAVSTPVVDVDNSQRVTVEIRMSAEAIMLEPLTVVERRWYGNARLDEFYSRADLNAKRGVGRIFFHEDVQRYASVRHILATVPRRSMCPMTILVDGLPVAPEDLDIITTTKEVEGVEIYRSAAEIPPQYAYQAGCGGVALVWTRPVTGGKFTLKRLLIGFGTLTAITLLVR